MSEGRIATRFAMHIFAVGVLVAVVCAAIGTAALIDHVNTQQHSRCTETKEDAR